MILSKVEWIMLQLYSMKKGWACGNYPVRGLTVDALIIENKEILLIKRKKYPFARLWALPGGHLDFDETLEDAVIREVKEETGLDVISLRLFKIYSSPYRHPQQSVAVVYQTKVKGKSKAGDDAAKIKFFSLKTLPQKLAFDHSKIITDYLRIFRFG